MLFQLLGPLQIGGQGPPSSAGAPQQQAVLAVLLAHANTFVPADALIEQAWNGRPPPSARRAVHVYVFRLRRVLAAHVGEPTALKVLATAGNGYVLQAGPDQLDATRFRHLVTDGHRALRSGRADRAGTAISAALALWRGPALAGVAVESVRQSLVIPLEELRLTAMQTKIDAALELGRHEVVIPELWELVALHPYREAFRAQLMVALYRSGRQADALTVYDQARRQLRDEFGADPGTALQQLHHAVLRSDAALATLPRTGELRTRPLPAEVPHDVAVLSGRGAELDQLADIAAMPHSDSSIVLLHGGPGVGKTAVAVRFAHQVAQDFPDGQLFANLRGFDRHRGPATTRELLIRFLRALDADDAASVGDLDALAAHFRSLMADRKMLIFLDDAADADQVRPLLPGRSTSLVLVTSRRTLTDLVAVDGAQGISLDVLDERDACGLLRELLGHPATADPASLLRLARLCAFLPLALRIAAAILLARPAPRVADLVDDLIHDGPLAVLGVSEGTAVRAAFERSCRELDPAARRLFSWLGRARGSDLGSDIGSDIGSDELALLADTDPPVTARLLGVLTAEHLVEEHRPGRYRQHDLLRAYAAGCVTSSEPETGR